MLPLAPLVAVTQAAPDGEGHGDLLRHFQGDTLGQVGVVVIQFDGRHNLHFDTGRKGTDRNGGSGGERQPGLRTSGHRVQMCRPDRKTSA